MWNFRRVCKWVTFLAVMFLSFTGRADEFDAGVRNADLTKRLPMQERIDQVDPHTGNLIVRHVDLRWKGNGGLDIVVNRNYDLRSMLNGRERAYNNSFRWTALGIGWTMLVAPRWVEFRVRDKFGGKTVTDLSYLCGNGISPYAGVPEASGVVELPSGEHETVISLGNGRGITKTNWRAECRANNLYLTSPDGLSYELGNIESARQAQDGWPMPIASAYVLPARKVTDANGNWITFEYRWVSVPPSQGAPLPTRITASDGRTVEFTYDEASGRLLAMNDNSGRTWSYQQRDGVPGSITGVVLPNGQNWRYAYSAGPDTSTDYAAVAQAYKLGTITYPEGGTVSYEYEPFAEAATSPPAKIEGARVRKRTTSNGDAWEYAYYHGSAGQYDRTTVSGPEGVVTYQHMGAGFSVSPDYGQHVNNAWQVGKLMERRDEYGNSETYTWSAREISPTSIRILEPELVSDARTWAADLAELRVVRDGAVYVTHYRNFDYYGNPQTVTETGPSGETRTTYRSYYTNAEKWIVNRLKNEVRTGNGIYREFDGNGNLIAISENGAVTAHTFDAQGNIASTTYPRNLVHLYRDYKRGIAQTEEQPEGISIRREVSAAGDIVAETNGEGFTKSFAFDGMGRPTKVNFAAGAPTTITYSANEKIATRGLLTERTVYDGFGREISVTLGGIERTFQWDALDRKVFESNPNSRDGTTYEFDILGRLKRTVNADGSERRITYAGATFAVSDERGYQTAYAYRSYGDPGERHLIAITTPEPGASVTIERDEADLVRAITQANVTRRFGYDGKHYLTTVVHPETGTTTFGRDEAGNMTSRVVGNSGTTIFAYDRQNRLATVSYPGDTPAVVKRYTKTNRLKSVSSPAAERTYSYDANDNLIAETLSADGHHFTVGYAYNGLDQLASLTYPVSGRTVEYAPDPLGRPTKVSGYVRDVSYWPSGQVREIEYGNGVITTYGQNSRLWPSSFVTKGANAVLNSSHYDFDGAGNLKSIIDDVDGSYNRGFGYDGLNRLTDANGVWGAGKLAYSGAGNLTNQNFGSYGLNYTFDGRNRLVSSSGPGSAEYSYDDYGNIVADGLNTYLYDGAPNLRCVNCTGAGKGVRIAYDGLNRRISVTRAGVTTYEVFGSHGNALIEYTPDKPQGLVEYMYLGGKRVAQRVSQ